LPSINFNKKFTFRSYEKPFDETAIAVTASIIFTFLVVGIIANSITIAVIMTYKALK